MWIAVPTLQLHPLAGAAIVGLDFDSFPASPDDRLDELAIRVLVARGRAAPTVTEYGPTVRRRRPAKSSGPSGLCGGRMTNRPANRPSKCSSTSRKAGGFERAELLAGAAAKIGPPGAQFVRASGGRGGAHENHLLCPRCRDLLAAGGQAIRGCRTTGGFRRATALPQRR